MIPKTSENGANEVVSWRRLIFFKKTKRRFLMEGLHLKIGEHHIKVLSRYGHLLKKFSTMYEMFPRDMNASPHLVLYIENGYGTSFLGYEVERINRINRITFRRADYLLEIDSSNKSAKLYYHDDLALKDAMENLYGSINENNK